MKYFIDFEATQYSNEIISIGCIRENGEEFYSLVNPGKKITPFITNLTGITNEMLINAPSPEVVFKDFFNWCAEYEEDLPVFYCYGNCDINFVRKNFNNSKNFKAKSILGYIYSGLFDYEPAVRKHFGLIQAVSLSKVASYYQEAEVTQTHNALEDAKMLKFVYEQIKQHSPAEDQDAFPEYQQQQNIPKVDNNWHKYRVYRYKKGKVVQTFNSLTDAVEWVYNKLPDNEARKSVLKSNLAKKIKNASNTDKKYINYKWKVEKK